jgi:hypothetical protein
MRYKIVRKEDVFDEKLRERFFVMREYKHWWRRTPRWEYCREFTYASMDTMRGEPVVRDTLAKAEQYIKSKLLEQNLTEEDVKIYECRDSKLDKILK